MNFKQMFSHPLLGATTAQYLRLLYRHRKQLDYKQVFKLIYILFSTLVISLISSLEDISILWKKDRTAPIKAPVFIIGHWRSGTTFLHYLMSKDQQFAYLNNTQAFMPNTMLIGRKIIKFLVRIHLLGKRPMDDVRLTPESAQEEEFAMTNYGMGAYLGWCFPVWLKQYFAKYTFFETCTVAEIDQFKSSYLRLLAKLSMLNEHKTLVLKNPANTARLDWLIQQFPEAKFIYLHRDDYEVEQSTRRLHEKLIHQFGLTPWTAEDIEDLVPENHRKMRQKYEATKNCIPAGQLMELGYQDLIDQSLESLEAIYRQLGLEGFEEARPAFEQFIAAQADYRRAVYRPRPSDFLQLESYRHREKVG